MRSRIRAERAGERSGAERSGTETQDPCSQILLLPPSRTAGLHLISVVIKLSISGPEGLFPLYPRKSSAERILPNEVQKTLILSLIREIWLLNFSPQLSHYQFLSSPLMKENDGGIFYRSFSQGGHESEYTRLTSTDNSMHHRGRCGCEPFIQCHQSVFSKFPLRI